MAITQSINGNHNVITYDAGTTLADLRVVVLNFCVSKNWELLASNTLITSDVFISLDPLGVAGTATHYIYIELDYSIPNRLCVRQWLSWSGSAGVSKSQNTTYFAGTGSAQTGTESQMGQPISCGVAGAGGILTINFQRCHAYIKGHTSERAGNVFNSGGTAILRRSSRIHSSDTLANGVPISIFCHLGSLSSVGPNATVGYRWSMPKGIDNSTNTTFYAGLRAGWWFPYTAEYRPHDGYYRLTNVSQSNENEAIGYPSTLDNFRKASPVIPIIGAATLADTVKDSLAELSNILRSVQVATNDILTITVDSSNVIAKTGSSAQFIILSEGIGMML